MNVKQPKHMSYGAAPQVPTEPHRRWRLYNKRKITVAYELWSRTAGAYGAPPQVVTPGSTAGGAAYILSKSRFHDLIKLLGGEEIELEDGFAERDVLGVRELCDLGGIFVSDVGIERGDKHERALHVLIHFLYVWTHTVHATQTEGTNGVGQQSRGLQKIIGDEVNAGPLFFSVTSPQPINPHFTFSNVFMASVG